LLCIVWLISVFIGAPEERAYHYILWTLYLLGACSVAEAKCIHVTGIASKRFPLDSSKESDNIVLDVEFRFGQISPNTLSIHRCPKTDPQCIPIPPPQRLI